MKTLEDRVAVVTGAATGIGFGIASMLAAEVAQVDPQYQRELLESIPMRRLAEPEDIGWAVRFLASEEAAYITGQTLVVDGGLSIVAPPFYDDAAPPLALEARADDA
jgi:NAD(P)-dependent dehydrogenase (short-subunit alcohol dehydrogenase family)